MTNAEKTNIASDLASIYEMYKQVGLLNERSFHHRFLLINSLLRNVVLKPHDNASHTPSIAVIGGTNVGKSTLTNALLGIDVASANMQAAYTRNTTAFIPSHLDPSSVLEDKPYAFWGFERSTVLEETHGKADQMYLRALPTNARIKGGVIWDTPDVDSVASQSYVQSVFEVASLAKFVLFVTTGQKYRDMAAVEVLEQLLEMCIPVVVVFNQHTDQQEALAHELRHLLRTRLSDPQRILYLIDIHRVPRLETLKILHDHESISILRRQIERCLESVPDDRERAGQTFISSHLDEVLSPALERLQSIEVWNKEVKSAVDKFFDTFRAAIPSDAILRFNTESEPPVSSIMPIEVARVLIDADRVLINTISKIIVTNKQTYNHSSFWSQLDKIWLYERGKISAEFKELAENHEANNKQIILQAETAMFDAIKKEPALLKDFRDRLNHIADDKSDNQSFVGSQFRKFLKPVTGAIIGGATSANIKLVVLNSNNELRSQLKSTGEELIKRERFERLISYGQKALKDTGGLSPSDGERITSLPGRIKNALSTGSTESSSNGLKS